MKRYLTIIITMIVILTSLRISLAVFSPDHALFNQFNPDQMDFVSLLKNPVIQLLFCFSLGIMLLLSIFLNEVDTGIRKNRPVLCALIAGLSFLILILFLRHGSYIFENFITVTWVFFYKTAYFRSQRDYIGALKSFNAAQMILQLLYLPIFVPIIYFLRKNIMRRG